MSHEAKPNEPGYDWDDPHQFHAGADTTELHPEHHDGHHVTSWQWLVTILFVLLALTALTVFSAEAERWFIGLGVHITHFWNVVIALSIALVKASLVCMYFMHLKHDNPLNTIVLLTTLFIFGLFLLFTGIDLGGRDAVNEFKADYLVAGGTGFGVAPEGGSFRTNLTDSRKQERIDAYANQIAEANGRLTNGEPDPNEDDILAAEHEFWFDFYQHKHDDHPHHLPERHHYDKNNHHADWIGRHVQQHGLHEVSTPNVSIPRHGITPNLYAEHQPAPHDPHAEHRHDAHGHGDTPGHDDTHGTDSPVTPAPPAHDAGDGGDEHGDH